MANSSILLRTLCVLLAIGVNSQEENFLIKSNVDLSVTTLKALAKKPGSDVDNIFFSPSSLLTGIAMLYEGMGDSTRDIVAKALGFPRDHALFRNTFAAMSKTKHGAKTVANLIIVALQANVYPFYAQAIKQVFGGQAFRKDFSRGSKRVALTINKRINNITNGGIKNFLSRDSVDASTRLLLINAVYLKADWNEKFDPQTELLPFKTNAGKTIQVPFMLGQITAGYEKLTDGSQIIVLPMEENEYYFVIVVPPNKDILSYLEEDLSSNEVMAKVVNAENVPTSLIALNIPKFSLSRKYKLKHILAQKPGLEVIFQTPDFSRLAATEPLVVDEVHHKAVVDVNPNGVEASAATGISITLYSGFVPDVLVTVDTPFLFFITEAATKNILFAGLVNNPLTNEVQ